MEKIIPFPSSQPDVCEMMVDGKPETMLSARGVVLLALDGWKAENIPESRDAMRRYCEYIALHGGQTGASAAFSRLESMSMPHARAWVKATFDRYVQDKEAVVQYVLNT